MISWQNAETDPALVVHPPGAVSLDEAHAAIEQWEFYSRKRLDPEQRLAVELMMAESVARMWAARTTGRAVSRQNGKGDEIEVVEAWDLTQRAAPIVHSAHEIPTAKSAHLRLVAHLEGHRDLRRRIKQVRYANGDQSIEMTNDGIIAYRTRTAGGGRGLDDIARLVVDEAQWAQPEQLASSTPILAVNPNPQTNYMGSAGIEGRSSFWWGLRKRAMAGGGGEFSWLEHSAEHVELDSDGRAVSTRPEAGDRRAWAAANFAFPGRISEEFLTEQLETLGPRLFSREHLCVWDPPDEDEFDRPISPAVWAALAKPHLLESRPDVSPTFFVQVAPDSKASAISVAYLYGDRPFVELADYRPGTSWLADRCADLDVSHPGGSWSIEAAGAAGSELPALEVLGIVPKQFSAREMGQACAHIQQLASDRAMWHSGDAAYAIAVQGAEVRPSGEGLWIFSERKSSVDVSPVLSAAGALWALESDPGLPQVF